MQVKNSFPSFVLEKMEPQEKILKTALELFYKYGIKRVTMDEIAKELGMSKKTIYHYYKEKDDLVDALCSGELQRNQSLCNDIANKAKDPIHEVALISENMTEMFKHINPVFFLDLQKFYPTPFERFQKFKEEFAYKNILANLKKGKETGIYRADINEDFVARYRIAQIDMLMFGNYYSFEKISFTKSHEMLLDMFVYGICTVKGHKLINNYKKIKEEE